MGNRRGIFSLYQIHMIRLVKVISTELGTAGRRIIKALGLGKGDVQTAIQAAPFGSDSNPPEGFRAIYAKTGTKGDTFIIGYINVDQVAEVGEHRLFSTDEQGNLAFEARMRNDGTFELGGSVDNLARYSELEKSFNELKGDFNDHVTDYNGHTHPTTATISSGPPGVITPTTSLSTPSAADITPAKIEELKTS